jgi:hypothetical protein
MLYARFSRVYLAARPLSDSGRIPIALLDAAEGLHRLCMLE